MLDIASKTREISGVAPGAIPYDELVEAGEPVIMKGVAKDWPLVRHGLQSAASAMKYLKSFDAGRPVTGYIGPPDIGGRFFYNEDVTGPNYEAAVVRFDEFLDQIREQRAEPAAPYYYIGSTDVDLYLPGLREENDLVLNNGMFERNHLLVSIWIGNRTVAAAHYDMSNNISCCMVGKRRFTLFPPDQVHNLYPGPLEPTPGGQVVSMVDFRAPDFDRYPRFREALASAQVAELDPGDILFFPALWWHQVEALDSFNTMINYWWNDVPRFIDNPMDTLLHGLLSIRDRPLAEKKAWQELFNYYVFGPPETPAHHLPEGARGDLAPMDDLNARRLRAKLLQRFNR